MDDTFVIQNFTIFEKEISDQGVEKFRTPPSSLLSFPKQTDEKVHPNIYIDNTVSYKYLLHHCHHTLFVCSSLLHYDREVLSMARGDLWCCDKINSIRHLLHHSNDISTTYDNLLGYSTDIVIVCKKIKENDIKNSCITEGFMHTCNKISSSCGQLLTSCGRVLLIYKEIRLAEREPEYDYIAQEHKAVSSACREISVQCTNVRIPDMLRPSA